MMQWVYHNADVAPAFVLARAGYDVWLGNNRGNRFSTAHASLDVKSKAYWQFSWEHMGRYDTPAVLDYITEQTGAAKVNFIGHSEGTTQVLAGASMDPDYYGSKINHAFLLAPVTTFRGTTNKYMHFWAHYGLSALQTTLELTHEYDLIPYGAPTTALCKLFDGKICETFDSIFVNNDPTVDDDAATANMGNYLPSGSGYRDFIHYW